MSVWAAVLALPLLLVLTTAFAKTSVVLGALRIGLGAEALLGAPVMLALTLIVTALVMGPTASGVGSTLVEQGGVDALARLESGAWAQVLAPLLAFVGRHASAEELEFFAGLSGRAVGDPLVVVSAFVVTELGEALVMAVMILVPFVLVDLVVAQTLGLMGLVLPSQAALVVPLKVLLFLSVGGWDVVVGGLVRGYA